MGVQRLTSNGQHNPESTSVPIVDENVEAHAPSALNYVYDLTCQYGVQPPKEGGDA